MTGPDKTGLIALFCISRNTIFNIECTVLLWWLDTVTPDILYNKCSYMNAAGGLATRDYVISRIDSIGGGRGGGWETEGGSKQPLRLKEQCCAFSLWHKLIQSTKEAKTGVRSSLVPHAVLLMPSRAIKCTLVV